MWLVIFVDVTLQELRLFLVINVFSLKSHFLPFNQTTNVKNGSQFVLTRFSCFLSTKNVSLLIICPILYCYVYFDKIDTV